MLLFIIHDHGIPSTAFRRVARSLPRMAKARAAALHTPRLSPEDCRSKMSRKLSDATKILRFSQQNERFPTVNKACRCTCSSTFQHIITNPGLPSLQLFCFWSLTAFLKKRKFPVLLYWMDNPVFKLWRPGWRSRFGSESSKLTW